MSESDDTGTGEVTPVSFAPQLDRLVVLVQEMITVLEGELVAALAGDRDQLERCSARKTVLMASFDAAHSELASWPEDRREALAGEAGTHRIHDAMTALRAAIATNEAGLRGAADAVRRIFVTAARLQADADSGYGPTLRSDDGGPFFGYRSA